jgi:hypothetical protein
MLILENNHPPMIKLTQPWKLRRSFGSQFVGNVAGPRWPEAGIAAPVIPSQSSRWTFCKGQSPTADLPTCRIWVLDFSDSSEVSPAFKSKAGNFTASFSSRPRLPSQGPAIVRTSSSVFRARCNLPKFSLSRWKQRGTKK